MRFVFNVFRYVCHMCCRCVNCMGGKPHDLACALQVADDDTVSDASSVSDDEDISGASGRTCGPCVIIVINVAYSLPRF